MRSVVRLNYLFLSVVLQKKTLVPKAGDRCCVCVTCVSVCVIADVVDRVRLPSCRVCARVMCVCERDKSGEMVPKVISVCQKKKKNYSRGSVSIVSSYNSVDKQFVW